MRQQPRIQGQQGLPLNERNFQTLVETIPTLVWRARPDGNIDYVNKHLLEYLGSPRKGHWLGVDGESTSRRHRV